MLGKAMHFATMCTVAFAILGDANRVQDAATSKGTADDLEHRLGQAKGTGAADLSASGIASTKSTDAKTLVYIDMVIDVLVESPGIQNSEIHDDARDLMIANSKYCAGPLIEALLNVATGQAVDATPEAPPKEVPSYALPRRTVVAFLLVKIAEAQKLPTAKIIPVSRAFVGAKEVTAAEAKSGPYHDCIHKFREELDLLANRFPNILDPDDKYRGSQANTDREKGDAEVAEFNEKMRLFLHADAVKKLKTAQEKLETCEAVEELIGMSHSGGIDAGAPTTQAKATGVAALSAQISKENIDRVLALTVQGIPKNIEDLTGFIISHSQFFADPLIRVFSDDLTGVKTQKAAFFVPWSPHRSCVLSHSNGAKGNISDSAQKLPSPGGCGRYLHACGP